MTFDSMVFWGWLVILLGVGYNLGVVFWALSIVVGAHLPSFCFGKRRFLTEQMVFQEGLPHLIGGEENCRKVI